jgi:adenylate cyclase
MKPKRVVALSAIVVAAVALAVGLEALGELAGVAQFEAYTLDLRQRTTSESFQAGIGDRESDIALVLFDEFSVMDSIEGWDWISPFPRTHLADLIGALSLAGARTIGLDVYLDRLYPGLNGDGPLRNAMERAGNVVLVTPVQQTDSGPVSAPPHPYFADVAASVGTAELPASFETFRDGVLAVRSGRALSPSFALALYAHAQGLDVDSLLGDAARSGRIELPGLPPSVGEVDPEWLTGTGASGRSIVPFRIRYVGPPSSPDAEDQAGTFTAVTSFAVPLVAPLTPEVFEDKVVLLGTGFHPEDRFRTPFFGYTPPPDSTLTDPEPYAWMYGVEVHANALQNMLDGEYVHGLGGPGRVGLLLLAALFTGALAFRGAAWGGGALAVTIVGVSALAGWAWAGEVYVGGLRLFGLGERFLWVPVATPLLSAAFAYVGSVAYVSIVEGREKRYIKSAFGMYLSPDIVAKIADNPAALHLGGAKLPLTLLFSDLAGFTSISEKMAAEDLVTLLNEYLDEMTGVVIDELGYVDKYIGDAIMAFWNAPQELADHPDRGLRTAIRMQRRMDGLNRRWAERDPSHRPLQVRIGVHTGEAVVGNVGGRGSINYSAIGDDVNLAARLEPANKDYGTLTMVSADVLDAAEGSYRVRALDTIAVVGKEEPVRVFELIEEESFELPPDRETALRLFDAGMEAYRRHAWAEAKAHFEAAVAACPDDQPSRLYARRCDENIAEPPPPDWDFVVRRTKK